MTDTFTVEFSDSFGPKALAICATFDDYDGAPDGGHSLGLGYDKLDAAIDLLEQEGECRTITIDLMDTPFRETMTASVTTCLDRLYALKAKEQRNG